SAALQKLFAAYNCTSPSVFLKTDDCFCTSFVTLENDYWEHALTLSLGDFVKLLFFCTFVP
ncbi:MAG: hypothetical protein KBT10_08985, partial [Bacteroidales bacterium]|nr:hypothetical protein [Candidatus Sodaliphilus aphodohippi]